MGRPKSIILQPLEHPRSAELLWRQQSSEQLEVEWDANAAWHDRWRSSAPATVSALNPSVYDPDFGVGPLARAHHLRDVFKTILRREGRDASDEGWQFGIANQTDCRVLFSPSALSCDPGSWLRSDSGAYTILRDRFWHLTLCEGNGKNGDRTVQGLNNWFGDRYTRTLPERRMTPELLFRTPFFGRGAHVRYLRFVCTGIYEPGANRSLLPSGVPQLPAHHEVVCQNIMAQLREPTNAGKPIISVASRSPTLATALAARLVRQIEAMNGNVCYIPVSKRLSDGLLNDGGLESIAGALYRYVRGFRDASPRVPSQEYSLPLKTRLAAIRGHLMASRTVVIFDGFDHAGPAYDALIDFIRDEPLRPLLSYLGDPSPGQRPLAKTLEAFNGCFFVILGNTHPEWLSPAQKARYELAGGTADLECLAAIRGAQSLRSAIEIKSMLAEGAEGVSEADLRLADMVLTQPSPPREARAVGSFREVLSARFGDFWSALRPWERVFLRALSLSETGLRWSTAFQVLESYAKACKTGEPEVEDAKCPSFGEFRDFIVRHSSFGGAPLLLRYPDSVERDQSDAFSHPSQIADALSDTHPWIMALEKEDRSLGGAIDFLYRDTRHYVWQYTRGAECCLLRRILCALALQAHRIRMRTTPFAGGDDIHATRHLAEALLHGLLSLDPRHERSASRSQPGSRRVSGLPDNPADAFAFLYFGVYKDMLCRGDLTHIGRRLVNGELEIDLLLLTSNPEDMALDAEKPGRTVAVQVRVPVWLEHGKGNADSATMRRAGRQHLMALCHSARRAMRGTLFVAAIEEWERRMSLDRVGEKPEDLHEKLSFAKLKVDLEVVLAAKGGPSRKVAEGLFRYGVRAVMQCAASRDSAKEKAAKVRVLLSALRRSVCRYVDRQLAECEHIAPDELESMVQRASTRLHGIASPHKLPSDAISLLTRAGVMTARAGAVSEARGSREEALGRYLSAICLLWLSKVVASARRRENPLGAPSRVSALAATELVCITRKVQDICAEISPMAGRWLLPRLHRLVRSTLDTFTREQASNRADRIVMQILESAYARSTGPRQRLSSSTGTTTADDDPGLRRLDRCCKWLMAADEDLLGIRGRPGLRMLFCHERIGCFVDEIDRVCAIEAGRAPAPATGLLHQALPLMEWIAYDLSQMENLIRAYANSMSDRNVAGWLEMLRARVEETSSRLLKWQLRHRFDLWEQARETLRRSVDELERRMDYAGTVRGESAPAARAEC